MFETLMPVVLEASKAIMSFYKGPLDIEQKDDKSPLTQADLAAHHIIEQGLKEHYPDIPIISEEGEVVSWEIRQNWDRFFLVDPLDGTKDYIAKTDEFSINIALIEAGRPIWGLIYLPVTEECFWAKKDEGAFSQYQGVSRILKSDHQLELESARIAVSRSHPMKYMKTLLSHLPNLRPTSVGSAIKFGFLSDSRLDLYIRRVRLGLWDTAAGDIILHESGGLVCGLETKGPLNYHQDDLRHAQGFIALCDPEKMNKVQEVVRRLIDQEN